MRTVLLFVFVWGFLIHHAQELAEMNEPQQTINRSNAKANLLCNDVDDQQEKTRVHEGDDDDEPNKFRFSETDDESEATDAVQYETDLDIVYLDQPEDMRSSGYNPWEFDIDEDDKEFGWYYVWVSSRT